MKFLTSLKKRFVENMTFARDHFTLFVLFGAVMLLFGVIGIVGSFLAAFWLNGLCGTHFDLSHCWQGVGAIASGVATLWTVAQASNKKYEIDSSFNSKQGEKPCDMETKK